MNEKVIDRRDLLKLLGAGGAAIVGAGTGGVVWSRLATFAAPEEAQAAAGTSLACVLSPAKTEGPYFVDERLNRSDIRTDPSDNSVQTGVPLKLTIRTFDADRGCTPVAGAVVDVWHANAQGAYSDVAQNGTNGKKFLRGFQRTDASGAADFTTIYPGWYQGRTIHIHFKVRLYDGAGESYEFTSQVFFDEATNNAVMAQPAYNRGRTRDVLNANDTVYGGDGARLLASASGGVTAGYTATFDVGLGGLPASAASGDSAVASTLTRAAFDRTANGQRRLTLTLDVDETVSAEVKLMRNGKALARRRFATLKAGTRRPALPLAKTVAAGSARLQVTIEDASGNTKVVRKTVRVPAA